MKGNAKKKLITRNKRRYLPFLMVIAFCLCAIVCNGRVFLRWGARAQSIRAMEAAGGKTAYEAAVSVNGGKGQLTVFSFDKVITEVIRDLGRIFDADNFNYSGGSMASASISTEDRVLRLVIIQPADYRQTLVFTLEQSASEFKVSRKKPVDRHLMKTVPPYPGSEPVFFARDENTRMSMAVSGTQSTPADVRDFFRSRLAASGWSPILPPASGARRGPLADPVARHGQAGMTVYLKGREIFCVFVDSSEVPGENRITLLHKQQEMK